jgi:hypothetical protein
MEKNKANAGLCTPVSVHCIRNMKPSREKCLNISQDGTRSKKKWEFYSVNSSSWLLLTVHQQNNLSFPLAQSSWPTKQAFISIFAIKNTPHTSCIRFSWSPWAIQEQMDLQSQKKFLHHLKQPPNNHEPIILYQKINPQSNRRTIPYWRKKKNLNKLIQIHPWIIAGVCYQSRYWPNHQETQRPPNPHIPKD